MNTIFLQNTLLLNQFSFNLELNLNRSVLEEEKLSTKTPSTLNEIGFSDRQIEKIKNDKNSDLEVTIRFLEEKNHHLITFFDDDYPLLLKEISSPPFALFAIGNTSLLNLPQIAIVGSRNPSFAGKENAFSFANFLSLSGFVITSGMALGIDTHAHLGALPSKRTIAVWGTGLDQVYPKSNQKLAESIAQNGLIISEFPLKTPPKREYFPRRNRMISGMSLGTLVIEAAIKSGSLITARLASEQGREIFAIPGSIHNPLAKGCHYLIKQGAKLVETAKDIVEDLPINLQSTLLNEAENKNQYSINNLDKDHKTLLDKMGFDPISIDKLVDITSFNSAEIASMLLILELDGLVTKTAGKYIRCK